MDLPSASQGQDNSERFFLGNCPAYFESKTSDGLTVIPHLLHHTAHHWRFRSPERNLLYILLFHERDRRKIRVTIQPFLYFRSGNPHGHAVMNRAHDIISWLSDDGKGIISADAREEKSLLPRAAKSDALLVCVPLVEIPGGNDAAPACGEFLSQRFRAGVMISPTLRGKPHIRVTARLPLMSTGAGFPGRTSPTACSSS